MKQQSIRQGRRTKLDDFICELDLSFATEVGGPGKLIWKEIPRRSL